MPAKSYTFPRTHKLKTRLVFSAVFTPKVRETRGPLVMYGIPNDLNHPRLGIAIGRPVGNAVRRNRIKRLLREAFRHHQYDLPTGYDLVIVVRPHEPFTLAEYQKLLTTLMVKLHGKWGGRGKAVDS